MATEYILFLKNESLSTQALVSFQRAWENYNSSIQGSLDNNFIWWNGKKNYNTPYPIYFLACKHTLQYYQKYKKA